MHISYQPLRNTEKVRGVRKENLRLAACLTTDMIANMGKRKISAWPQWFGFAKHWAVISQM